MTARTKLTIVERAHTLLMLAAGVAVGWFVMAAIPVNNHDGLTVRDVMQLALSLLAAYAAAFVADQLVNLAALPLRRRLYAAAASSRPQVGDAPIYQPTPSDTVRDPEAMDDEPSQIWEPDDIAK